MNRKSSAHYQREYRKRLREQGLVKKEVWILPEHARLLAGVEKRLRQPKGAAEINEMEVSMNAPQVWTTNSLFEALKGVDLFKSGEASLEMIEGSEASLHVTMAEYGDLPLFLTVVGEQILVEAILWPEKDVKDVTGFNDEVLRTHKLFPLSTISLDVLADGESYYTMFGALSATSILSNVVFEIEMLADNVIKATEAYEEFLTVAAA